MSIERIYLDNNATTVVFPEVLSCLTDCWQNAFANPGSQHGYGRDARRVLEDSREQIAEILHADASEVIFTSGGTESINMAVHGFTSGRRGTIALTAGEHPATRQACERASQSGMDLHTLEVYPDGSLRADQFEGLPWDRLKLVCLILAHNETGIIQDVEKLSVLCRQHGVPLLLDAVQAVGKVPVNFQQLQATAIAFGAHKFHGPRGVGGLLLRRGIRIPPFMEGGHQESGRRAGTEPVPLIAGMARALKLWQNHAESWHSRIAEMRDWLQETLLRQCEPAIVHGVSSRRLPNTLSIAFPGVTGEALLVNLHLQQVACSLGSTCASGSAEPAPALLAMGVPAEICNSTVRFSLSIQNTMLEIQEAAARIASTVQRLRDQTSEVQNEILAQ